MKKSEIEEISLPLSWENFEKLKYALEHDKISRPDIPDAILMAMDKMWARDNQEIYDDYRRRGIFGEYD